MSELILVRHGQASFRSADYDRLSPLGHQQAAWLGAYFDAHDIAIDRCLRGSLRRHRETADGIAGARAAPSEFEEDIRLNEFDADPLVREYMEATGLDSLADRADFLRHFPPVFEGWEAGRFRDAVESYAAFSARVEHAMEDALSRGGTTLIVTSGGVIAVMLRRVLGLTNAATADILLNIHNASIHRLVAEGGRLRLALYNASPHLDPRDKSHARTFI
ncbi:MAG: histidine phosphatase family protein [Pseudomonadota bacterium]